MFEYLISDINEEKRQHWQDIFNNYLRENYYQNTYTEEYKENGNNVKNNKKRKKDELSESEIEKIFNILDENRIKGKFRVKELKAIF